MLFLLSFLFFFFNFYFNRVSGTPPRPKKPAIDPHEDDLTEYTSYCTRIRDEEIYHDLCSVKGTSVKPAPAQNGHHSGHVSHTFAASREFGAFAAVCFDYFYCIKKYLQKR